MLLSYLTRDLSGPFFQVLYVDWLYYMYVEVVFCAFITFTTLYVL